MLMSVRRVRLMIPVSIARVSLSKEHPSLTLHGASTVDASVLKKVATASDKRVGELIST